MHLKRLATIIIAAMIILISVYLLIQRIRRPDIPTVAARTEIPVSVAIAQMQKLATTFTLPGLVSSRTGTNDGQQPAETISAAGSMALVWINIAEREAFRLRSGDTVKVTTDRFPGYIFLGRINMIAARARGVHTFPVEISVEDNEKYPLEPGTSVQITINYFTPDQALAIPRQALIGSKRNMKVFRIKKGRANQRIVVIGRQSNEFVEVLNGLNRGDSVVVSGKENLTEGTAVTFINP